MLKRFFDVALSLFGLLAILPIMSLIAVAVRLDSSGPVFFRQTRIGRGLNPFILYKFRTMTVQEQVNYELTCGSDSRITRLGAILRKLKLDEIPQLWNVLRGDMSLVGPRPQTPAFVEKMQKHYEEILLSMRPGITDLASIYYRYESELLGQVKDPINYYLTTIMPEKMRLQLEYIERQSLWLDLNIIFWTMLVCFDVYPKGGMVRLPSAILLDTEALAIVEAEESVSISGRVSNG